MTFQEHIFKALIGGIVACVSYMAAFLSSAIENAPVSINTISNLTFNAALIYAVVHLWNSLKKIQKEASDERVAHAEERGKLREEHSIRIADMHASTIRIMREDADRAEASRAALRETIEGLRADLKK